MNGDLEKFVQQNKEAFDDRIPGADVLARIQERIASKEVQPPVKGILISFKAVRWAVAACVILLAGAAIWWMNDDKNNNKNQSFASNSQAKPITTQPITEEDKETMAIDAEPSMPVNMVVDRSAEQAQQRKQVLFASLANMESPSTRIAATMKAYDLKNADKDIVDALVSTMNSDPSTNVRLAALDALSRFYREPYVKKQLIGSLKKQKDPMVQIELIQLLTQMKQKSILTELEKMVQDVNTNDAVKDRAYSSILTLGS